MLSPAGEIRSGLKTGLLGPAGVTLLALLAVVGAIVVTSGGDPLSLARLGSRYSPGPAVDIEGYDGQFVYYIALDPRPAVVAPRLDVPAYRYQRILLPLLARWLSLGQAAVIPWALVVIGVLSHVGGTWVVGSLLERWGISRWYALSYGLWAGFILAVRLDLPEPLAYGLVAGAIWAGIRGWKPASWALFGLALFAKEVTVLFVLTQAIVYAGQRRARDVIGLSVFTLVPFGAFQIWLWRVFGAFGLASGGNYATPFELVPFMGLARIGQASLTYLAATLVVFGPAVIIPALWGLWSGLRRWLAGGTELITASLLIQAAIIPFLPFSTLREPGGWLRFASGLVLALLLFAGRYHHRRVLNYSPFWLILNVFLLK